MTGRDGNAFFILGRCKGAVRDAWLPDSVFQDFNKEATSGDYDNLLRTVMRWFDWS